MILVTVGMHTDGFLRLVKEMDCMAATLDEEVVMQIGATPYRPTAARWFTFATQAEMEALCAQARVIVSHAGAGSILTVLRYGKPLIVMPRLRKYGEHMDDHQLELAEALQQAGLLLVAHEAQDLWPTLREVENFRPGSPDSSNLLGALRQAVVTDVKRSR